MERAQIKAAANQAQAKRHLLVTLALALIIAGLDSAAFGQTARLAGADRSKRVALISIPDRKLAVLEDGDMIATFPVAVGAALSSSPTGEFQIVSRVANPTYYRPSTVIPAGKSNPLGTRWLGLSEKGYGIHGTNAPRSIGQAASHGCIRLRNRDMERLFTMLRVGDVVEIRGERDDEIAQIFDGADEDAAGTEAEQASGK